MDSLAQTYRWTHDDIMNRTLPQLLMYRFSGDVNRQRGEEHYERKKLIEELRKKREDELNRNDPYVEEYGKRMSELDSAEQAEYMMAKMRQART